MVIQRDRFFYPNLTLMIDSFSCSQLFLFIYLRVPVYAKMKFQMMTLLEVLGKIAGVR